MSAGLRVRLSPSIAASCDQRAAIGRDAARRADALQPADQRRRRKPARRMQLAADIAQRFEHIALDHHLAMTGDVDELGDVLQEPLPAGAQRRGRRLRRAEAAQRRPEQKRDRDHALDRRQHEGKAEQQQQRICRLRDEAVDRLVEYDAASAAAQCSMIATASARWRAGPSRDWKSRPGPTAPRSCGCGRAAGRAACRQRCR